MGIAGDTKRIVVYVAWTRTVKGRIKVEEKNCVVPYDGRNVHSYTS